MFIKRIIVFNETFAALGAAGKNTTVVWHEAIAGRFAQDICSTYWNFFVEKQRNTEHIVLWADNCSAQNKNWQFFTFLASAVNSNLIAAKTIRMNYLVTGHTFMSADSVHSAIERELKKKGYCCDWQDFTSVLENANCGVINKAVQNFLEWRDGSNRTTISRSGLNLANMAVVEFRRGSRSVLFKPSHQPSDEFEEGEFLKKTFSIETLPASRTQPRGIPSLERADIIKIICPMMPESRRTFWNNLPSNSTSLDLIDNFV